MLQASRLRSNQLKVQLESELNHTRSGRCAGDLSEVSERDVIHRIGVIYPIKQVEKFGAEFGAESFVDRNEFYQRNIHVFLSRSGQEIARCIAERIIRIKRRIIYCADARAVETRTRRNECALVEISRQTI